MKKFIAIIFLLSAAIFSSCEKLATEMSETSDFVEVSFKPQIVSGYIPTKTFSDEVLDNLPFDYPKEIKLYGANNQIYTVDLTTTNTISLQKGKYYIQASVGCFDDCHITSQKSIPLIAGTQTITINGIKRHLCGEITITDAKSYTIDLTMAGFVVACDKNEVSYFKYEDYASGCTIGVSLKNSNCFESGNYYYYILALSSELLEKGSSVYKYAGIEMGATDKNEKTYKTLYVTAGGDKSVLGKYYIFTPNENNYREFDFSTSNWTNGGTI